MSISFQGALGALAQTRGLPVAGTGRRARGTGLGGRPRAGDVRGPSHREATYAAARGCRDHRHPPPRPLTAGGDQATTPLHLEVDDGVPVEAERLGEDLVAVLVELGACAAWASAGSSNCTGLATSSNSWPPSRSSACSRWRAPAEPPPPPACPAPAPTGPSCRKISPTGQRLLRDLLGTISAAVPGSSPAPRRWRSARR